MCIGGTFLALLLVACGSEGTSGPALVPRPEVQTCLPDVSAGMPELLSETGCFSDLKTLEPGPDLIPYDVNSELWTDSAFKPRFLVVPSPEQITAREDGSWSFPDGSVLVKVFGFEFESGNVDSRRPVETRFMVRDAGRWIYSTYQWNDEGTDGQLLDEEVTVELTLYEQGQPVTLEYTFPDAETCTFCHGVTIDDVLGPKTSQLNRDRNYDGVVANQLTAMAEIDLFALDGSEEVNPSQLPRMASPQRGEGDLEHRARAYLDANCAHCHRPGGWVHPEVGLDFRYEVPLADSGICDPMKYAQWAGKPRLVPGDPEASGIMQRFLLETAQRMPSIATSVIDPLGEDLLSEWIRQVETCP